MNVLLSNTLEYIDEGLYLQHAPVAYIPDERNWLQPTRNQQRNWIKLLMFTYSLVVHVSTLCLAPYPNVQQ